MKIISLFTFLVLLASCGKDKKQIPAPTNQQLKSQSSQQRNATAASTKRKNTAVTAHLKKYIDKELRKKEMEAVHCIMTIEMKNGDRIPSHSLYTFERTSKRRVNVRQRVIGKDMESTISSKPKHKLKIAKDTKVSKENFSLVHNSNNELEGVKFEISSEGKTIHFRFPKVTGDISSSTECTLL